MKEVHRRDLVPFEVYRNPINTVKLRYLGLDSFKILEYFKGDFYRGFSVGDIITKEEASYTYFNYHDKDN